jgi:Protein of unknown function, DUF481
MKRLIKQRFICCVIFITAVLTSYGQKTDKVYLKNGDILTGEIKSLNLAILAFDMTGPGTISIKWEEVTQIRSDKLFVIKFRDGSIRTEHLDSSFYGVSAVSLDNIIEIDHIRTQFIKRLYGNVDLGFNYSKSSEYVQLNFAASVSYRLPKWEFKTDGSFNTTNKYGDSTQSKIGSFSIHSLLHLPDFYYVFSEIGWQKNTELGLANRYLYNGGAGKSLIASNHNLLRVATGLSFNIEESIDGGVYTRNLDLLALVNYKLFYNSSPKKTLNASVAIFPSVTDWGRIRMEFDLSGRVEAFKDFFIGLVFYDNYDSKPLEGAFSNNDFGLNFTLSYNFGN